MSVKNEELNKAIDSMIDEFFSEEVAAPKAEETAQPKEETVAKAKDAISEIIGDPKQASMEKDPNRNPATLADAPGNNPEKGEEDEKNGKKRGRPNDLSQMSNRDMSSGESKGSYDASIVEPSSDGSKSEDSQVKQPDWLQSKGSDKSANDSGKGPQSGSSQASSDQPSLSEFSQVKLPAHLAKADEKETVTLSKAEYEELKKARDEKEAAQKAEELKKAKAEQVDLIKSAVDAATADLRKELDEAKKLAKAVADKPRARKSIANIGVLEKGGFDESAKGGNPSYFTKSQMLDAAVELVKTGKISENDAIEFEMTGSIQNPESRKEIENFLRKK